VFPQPAKKADKLIDRLNNITNADTSNRFVMQGLKAGASVVIKDDPEMGHGLLGMIAALTMDIEEAHKQHQIALEKSGWGSSWAYLAYAVSCGKMGTYDKSVSLLKEAVEKFPGNLALADLYLDSCTEAGDITEAMIANEYWNKLSPQKGHDRANWLGTVMSRMDKFGVTGEQVSQAFLAAHKTHIAHHLLEESTSVHSYDGENPAIIFQVDAGSDVIAEMNSELADSLIDQDLVPAVSQVLTIGFATATHQGAV